MFSIKSRNAQTPYIDHNLFIKVDLSREYTNLCKGSILPGQVCFPVSQDGTNIVPFS